MPKNNFPSVIPNILQRLIWPWEEKSFSYAIWQQSWKITSVPPNRRSLWEKPRKAEKWGADALQSCFLKRHIWSWSDGVWERRSRVFFFFFFFGKKKERKKRMTKGVSFSWKSWDSGQTFFYHATTILNFLLTRNLNKKKENNHLSLSCKHHSLLTAPAFFS